MTITETILSLLVSGETLTVQELSTRTGRSIAQIRGAIGEMRERGYISSRPVSYLIAQGGIDRLTMKPKYPRRPKARKALTMVEIARKTQPNSVFAMGAMP